MYTINLTKEQFEQLQSNKALTINLDKPKQEKWTPSSGNWNVLLTDTIYDCITTSEKYSEAGMEYETEEEAIKASKALRSYARQLKWLSENSDGWEANWSDIDQQKYYITYIKNKNMYKKSYIVYVKSINTIYMSENNAEKLCRLLNEGVVEF